MDIRIFAVIGFVLLILIYMFSKRKKTVRSEKRNDEPKGRQKEIARDIKAQQKEEIIQGLSQSKTQKRAAT